MLENKQISEADGKSQVSEGFGHSPAKQARGKVKLLCVAENPQCRRCLEASSEQLMAGLLCVAWGWLNALAAGADGAAANPFILQRILLIFIYLSAHLRSPKGEKTNRQTGR